MDSSISSIRGNAVIMEANSTIVFLILIFIGMGRVDINNNNNNRRIAVNDFEMLCKNKLIRIYVYTDIRKY